MFDRHQHVYCQLHFQFWTESHHVFLYLDIDLHRDITNFLKPPPKQNTSKPCHKASTLTLSRDYFVKLQLLLSSTIDFHASVDELFNDKITKQECLLLSSVI